MCSVNGCFVSKAKAQSMSILPTKSKKNNQTQRQTQQNAVREHVLSERRGSCDAFIQDQAKISGILGAILVYIGPFVQNEKINNQFFKTTTQICSKKRAANKRKSNRKK